MWGPQGQRAQHTRSGFLRGPAWVDISTGTHGGRAGMGALGGHQGHQGLWGPWGTHTVHVQGVAALLAASSGVPRRSIAAVEVNHGRGADWGWRGHSGVPTTTHQACSEGHDCCILNTCVSFRPSPWLPWDRASVCACACIRTCVCICGHVCGVWHMCMCARVCTCVRVQHMCVHGMPTSPCLSVEPRGLIDTRQPH